MVHQPNSEKVISTTARAILDYLIEHPTTTKKKLTAVKCRIGKKHRFMNVIKDSVLLAHTTPEERTILSKLLRRRLTRTLSGVTIVAVMTKPYECPGDCVFCPGPDSQPGTKVAQSYTGREPAAMRSAMYNYDSYQQTFHRLEDLTAIGHQVDKIELIIMGGTFLYFPVEYQNEFIQGCYDAIINFKEPEFNNHLRSADINIAKQKLETAKTRLIGLTFETRPDYCMPEHVDRMLELGATRVEIGIQSTRDDLLLAANRKHTAAQNKLAIQVAKDAGLKTNAHMMPNLPLSNPQIDREVFAELFDDPNFRPDMLKIYPTLVIGGTKLYEMHQRGEYKPYDQADIIEMIADVKTKLPPYVRIQRIQRDIPAQLIIDGVKNSNLRQMVQKVLRQRGEHCKCIRCREEGFYAHQRENTNQPLDTKRVELCRFEYEASGGTEIFISFEDREKNILFGYLRLRFPSPFAHRSEINSQNTAIVREIRVVGEIVVHTDAPREDQIQHRGYGKLLMAEAERLAEERKCNKLLVIAGIGARPYFYKLGYTVDGVYVSRKIKQNKL